MVCTLVAGSAKRPGARSVDVDRAAVGQELSAADADSLRPACPPRASRTRTRARGPACSLVEVSRGHTAEATADHDQVVGFTGIRYAAVRTRRHARGAPRQAGPAWQVGRERPAGPVTGGAGLCARRRPKKRHRRGRAHGSDGHLVEEVTARDLSTHTKLMIEHCTARVRDRPRRSSHPRHSCVIRHRIPSKDEHSMASGIVESMTSRPGASVNAWPEPRHPLA